MVPWKLRKSGPRVPFKWLKLAGKHKFNPSISSTHSHGLVWKEYARTHPIIEHFLYKKVWLVVPTFKKIWKSVGIIIPNIWKNYPNVPNHQPVIGIILWVSPCSNTRHWHYKIWIQPATPATNGWRPLDAAGATIATPTRGLKLPPLARHRFRGTLRVELRWFLRKKGWFSALF